MDAIVTAGGRLKGALAAETGQQIKALLELDGSTLLERTVRALAGSASVQRIAVVGPAEVREVAEGAGAQLHVPEEKTGIDNLMTGLRALDAQGQVVFATSDLVDLRPQDVDDFVSRVPPSAGVSYAVVTKAEYDAAFPARRNKHFVGLKDGEFTGGCLFVVDAAVLRRIEPMLQGVFRLRKLPVLLGGFIGPNVLLKLALAQVLGRWIAPGTDELRFRVERALGCEAAIVRGASPRVTLDVDTRRDWEFAKVYLSQQQEAATDQTGGGER